MLGKVKCWLKENYGFSLVEAIVSVAIISIAVIPISVVFSTTITRTVDTRKQHEANELAQMYIENLKNKDFEEFARVFPGAGVEVTIDASTDSDDYKQYNMERVPSGYYVKLNFETDINDNMYKVDQSLVNAPVPVDLVVDVPSGYSDTFTVYDGTNDSIYTTFAHTIDTNIRNIRVVANRATDTIEVQLWDGPTQEATVHSLAGIAEKAVRFELGNSGSGSTPLETNIQVSSDLIDKVSVYVYEDDINTVQANAQTLQGYVQFSRNLYEITADLYRIVEIRVDVYDEYSNELLTSLTGTMISE